MQHICIIILPNMLASSVTLPLEMFHAAFAQAKTKRLLENTPKIDFIANILSPIQTDTGFQISPTDTFASFNGSPDLILVPGLWRNPFRHLNDQQALFDFLQQQTPFSQICAVGTGSTFLAQAGILDGRPATTHWHYFAQMEKRYPQVKWKRQHMITQSDNIFCAGSVNSVADLAVYFIQEFFNIALSKKVEQQFSPEVRQSYQQKLFSDQQNSSHQDELIIQAQNSISQQLFQNIDFAQLAISLDISTRTMQRRFKRATGLSPLQYQQQMRMKHAKTLLSDSNESIEGIALLLGYGDSSQFARIFKKHHEQSPQEFRQSVRGKLFSF